MKRFYKIFVWLFILTLFIFSNNSLAVEEHFTKYGAGQTIGDIEDYDYNTYKLTREVMFTNNRSFTLQSGFGEIMIGKKDATQYQDDIYFAITPKPDSITEDEYGNLYAHYDVERFGAGAKLKVTITQIFSTSNFQPSISNRDNE